MENVEKKCGDEGLVFAIPGQVVPGEGTGTAAEIGLSTKSKRQGQRPAEHLVGIFDALLKTALT